MCPRRLRRVRKSGEGRGAEEVISVKLSLGSGCTFNVVRVQRSRMAYAFV
jgi:hypothetical protein